MAAAFWQRNAAKLLAAGRGNQFSCTRSLSDLRSSAFCVFRRNSLEINGHVGRCLSTTPYWLGPPENEPPETDQEIQNNPFYHKYAEKISKAKKEGASKPVSMEQISYRMKYETKRQKKPIENPDQKSNERGAQSGEPKKFSFSKKLSDIMKLDHLQDKSGQEIGEIWTEFYKRKNSISAVIPGSIYDRIYSRSVSCPTFIYPLVKDQGYQFMLGQFSNNQCFFTSLLDYQVHGENAPWQLNLTHFTELQDDKGIVLMAGEIDQNALSILEAQCLAQQLQIFYATSDEERFQLVHTFNKEPDKFKYMDVIKEVEASRLIENLNVK